MVRGSWGGRVRYYWIGLGGWLESDCEAVHEMEERWGKEGRWVDGRLEMEWK